jgi:hypothetical protein
LLMPRAFEAIIDAPAVVNQDSGIRLIRQSRV